MKKILIAGQHSYLGTSFLQYLQGRAPKWQVDTISVHGDAWKKQDFSKYDAVFHVAGKAHADVRNASEAVQKEYDAVNRQLAVDVAAKAKADGVRQFVYPGSAIIYGDSAPCGRQKCITRQTVAAPADFYGKSKWQADQALQNMQNDTFRVAVLRLPMIYGPGSKGNYPLLAKLAKKLPVFPNVENERSMLYIGNLCEFLYQIIERQESGIFFPQNAAYVQTAELVKEIAEVHGHRIWISKCLNPFVRMAGYVPGALGKLVKKAFGNLTYQYTISAYEDNSYQWVSFRDSVRQTEQNISILELGKQRRNQLLDNQQSVTSGGKVLMTASVASMIDLFNRDNIRILQKMGKEVHVATNFSFGSITSQQRVDECKKELEQAGVIVHPVPIPRRMGDVRSMVQSYRMLRQIMREHDFELIHTQSPIGGVLTRMAAKKSRKMGTKVMYTAHGFHFFKGASPVNWLLFYPIERIFAHDTDLLLTMNQEDFMRAKQFKAKQVAYIPGIGIDLHKFDTKVAERLDTKAMRQSYGFAECDYIFLSVGQLSHRKNQEAVIRAMALIPDEKIKYAIVGIGEYEERFRQLISELHLESRVRLLGYSSKVNELLQMADCFIFPSLQEGLPVALMEAMASVKPIICSKIRGNTDLIEHQKSGILVEAKEVSGYAEAMQSMFRNPEQAAQFAAQARKKVEQFSKERVHVKMLEMYRRLLEN